MQADKYEKRITQAGAGEGAKKGQSVTVECTG